MTDIEIAYKALTTKQAGLDKLWNYYGGKHPLVYSAKRLEKLFKNVDAKFSENWCSVVVDSVLDRIKLERFTVEGSAEDKYLNELYRDREMAQEADQAHRAALVTTEGYIIAWPDVKGRAEAFYNDPRRVHVQPDSENPKLTAWAAKWWKRDDLAWRMNLYYPEQIEKYVTKAIEGEGYPSDAGSFRPLEDEPEIDNPYGVVPVFQFYGLGELTNVIDMQAAINKLVSDMMIASEFGALKQRYIIGDVDEKSQLKNAPNENWLLPLGTEVGEFSATELSNYIEAINNLVSAVSTISKTPKHYFLGQNGDPSGEALIAMEAPLNKKVDRYIRDFSTVWSKVMSFMALIEGHKLDKSIITPVFDDPATVQPKTEAEIIQAKVNAGMSLVSALREAGRTDDQIKQILKDKDEEQKRNLDTASLYMEQARQNANQEQI